MSGKIYAEKRNDCDSALMIWNESLLTIKDAAVACLTRIDMAVCYLRTGNIKEAEISLLPIAGDAEVTKFNERAKFLLGDIALYNGSLTKSEMIFQGFTRQYPQGEYTNDALMRLGAITILKEDSANIELISGFSDAMKAQTLGEYRKEADLLLSDKIGKSPIAEIAQFYAAVALQNGEADDRALTEYEKYIAMYQEGFYLDRAYLGIGDILAKSKNTASKARAAYNKILELYSDGTVTELARERILKLDQEEKIG